MNSQRRSFYENGTFDSPHIVCPIIPENTLNEDTSQILLNTGDLKITSKPRNFSEANFANRKNSDIDESTYYDHFDIQISDISVGLLPPESTLV